MKPLEVEIKPMKLSVRKMRANNLNNFDLSNTPDDVTINADGDNSAAHSSNAPTPKINIASIHKGINKGLDTINAASDLVKNVKSQVIDKSTVATPQVPVVEDENIMGVSKPIFFGVVALLAVGCFFAYKKFVIKK